MFLTCSIFFFSRCFAVAFYSCSRLQIIIRLNSIVVWWQNFVYLCKTNFFFFVSIRISNTRLLFMFGMSWHSCQHSRYVHVSSMAVFSVCGFSNVLIPQAILNIIHFSGIEVNGSTPFFFMCAARFLCDAKKKHTFNEFLDFICKWMHAVCEYARAFGSFHSIFVDSTS